MMPALKYFTACGNKSSVWDVYVVVVIFPPTFDVMILNKDITLLCLFGKYWLNFVFTFTSLQFNVIFIL